MVFGQKMEILSFSSFQQNRPKEFSDLVDRKQAMLDYINIDLKKSKIFYFSKRASPWFSVKNWQFCPCLFFYKIGQNKMFLPSR